MLDVWKEIWMAVSTNPQLAMQYNGPAIFEYMANLAGAKNLTSFKIQVAPPVGAMECSRRRSERAGANQRSASRCRATRTSWRKWRCGSRRRIWASNSKAYISSDSPIMWALSRVILQANVMANGMTTIDFTVDVGRYRSHPPARE